MRRYFEVSRTHSYSLLFALPLFLLYEAGVYWVTGERSGLRNGADVLLRSMLAAVGLNGTAALSVGVVVIAIFVILRERRTQKVRLRFFVFLGMFLESVFYAMLLGLVVSAATQTLLDAVPGLAIQQGALTRLPFAEAAILSLGAGLYEELVFRVLLVGGLFAALRGSGGTQFQASVSSVLLAAVVFSAFHYVGPYGDSWEVGSFVYRLLAGVAFSLLFLVRGFGITAWTHALYDLFLVAALTQ